MTLFSNFALNIPIQYISLHENHFDRYHDFPGISGLSTEQQMGKPGTGKTA